METLPYLRADAILDCLRTSGCWLRYNGYQWILYNVHGEAAGATSAGEVEALERQHLITWETSPAPQKGVRWIATEEKERGAA